MVEYIAVFVAVISAASAVAGAIITGRGNARTVEMEKTLPPYEALAARVGDIDQMLRDAAAREREAREREREARDKLDQVEERAEKLEDCYDKMERVILAQQDWIKEAVALAQITGAIAQLSAPPDWIDLDTPSMRQRREEMRKRHD